MAWVKVTYTPRDPNSDWSPSNADKWLVEGTLTTETDPEVERGTLQLLSAGTHYGQYSMPFAILIVAQMALPQ